MAHGASSLSDLSLFVSHELASRGSLEESGDGIVLSALCMLFWTLLFTALLDKASVLSWKSQVS